MKIRLVAHASVVVEAAGAAIWTDPWLSGKVFDVTGSYHAAFVNGIAWNLLNLTITGFLLWRLRGGPRKRDARSGHGAGTAAQSA